jgi:hypothetical protein
MAAGLLVSGCDGGGVSEEDDRAAVARAAAAFEDALSDQGFTASADDGGDDTEYDALREDCQQYVALLGEEEIPGSTASIETAAMERGALGTGSGTVESASAAITFVRTEATLDTMFDLLHDDLFEPCVRNAAEVGLSAGFSASGLDYRTSDLRVTRPVTALVGQATVALAVSGSVQVAGLDTSFIIEFQFARKGRALAVVTATALGDDGPFPDPGPLLQLVLDEAD